MLPLHGQGRRLHGLLTALTLCCVLVPQVWSQQGALATAPAAGVSSPALAFGELHRMLPRAENFADVVLADLDGNGSLDAFLGVGADALLLNDGTGRFRVNDGLPPGVSQALEVAAADVDQDGDVDLYLTGNGSDRLYLNQGDGSFSDGSVFLPALSGQGRDVVLTDVNGDGFVDVVIAQFGGIGGQPNGLLLGDGTGQFIDASSNLVGDSDPSLCLALADVDGDGDPDLAVGNRSLSPQDRLSLNDGNGLFTDATSQIPIDSENTTDMDFADVDGDGDPDLYQCGGLDRLLVNDGTGHFAGASGQLPSGHLSVAVVFADVDADGDLDVVNATGGVAGLLLNNGSGTFQSTNNFPAIPQGFVTGTAMDLDVGDLDGDGDIDVLVPRGGIINAQCRLYLNDGLGVFFDGTSYGAPVSRGITSQIELVDIDGDLDRDAVIVEGDVLVARNDGVGGFGDPVSALPVPLSSAIKVAAADFDGDGDADLVVGSLGENSLLLNDGRGQFADGSAGFPAGSDDTPSLAVLDVNGDANLDVFLGNTNEDVLMLGGGSGSFVDASSWLPDFANDFQTLGATAGDVDGDGKVDIVTGSQYFSTSVRLLLNTGASFTDGTPLLPGNLQAVYDVKLLDIESDGDLDLVIGRGAQSPGGLQTMLWRNEGAGQWIDATAQLPVVQYRTRSVRVVDIDDDGDVDLLFANVGTSLDSHVNGLLLNDGQGLFSDESSALPEGDDNTSTLAVADVDLDGDLDVVEANSNSENRVLFNREHQLAWEGLPRLGKSFSLRLWGRVGSSYGLFLVGTTGAAVPWNPWLLVATGPLNGTGEASLRINVPSDPSLVGVVVEWQAFLESSPVTAMSRELTTLRGF